MMQYIVLAICNDTGTYTVHTNRSRNVRVIVENKVAPFYVDIAYVFHCMFIISVADVPLWLLQPSILCWC